MATRRKLIEGVGQRYRTSSGNNEAKILEEFVRLTGYHRKHAIRVLNGSAAKPAERRTAPASVHKLHRHGARICSSSRGIPCLAGLHADEARGIQVRATTSILPRGPRDRGDVRRMDPAPSPALF
jgi:hypothetical protein